MSDTPTKYKWIKSSTACSSCQGMSLAEHTTKPDRPHDHCLCTIVSITGNTYGGGTDTLPRIISVVKTGGSTDYDEGSYGSVDEIKERGRQNFKASGEFYYDATVRCPKNNEIILSFVIVVEDGEMFDVIVNWGTIKSETQNMDDLNNWPPAKDDFEQEIMDAISDYTGGLDFKALEKAKAILASEGRDLCKM